MKDYVSKTDGLGTIPNPSVFIYSPNTTIKLLGPRVISSL